MDKGRFLRKLCCFFLPLLLLMGWLEYYLSHRPQIFFIHHPSRYYEKRLLLESCLKEIRVINVGNSHAFFGINYQQAGFVGFNLAELSQDLFYDQQLLFKYLDRLPNLKLAIIPISYLSLEYSLEDSPESWRKYHYARIYQLPNSRQPSLWQDLDLKNYSYIALYSAEEVQQLTLNYFKEEEDLNRMDKMGHLVVKESIKSEISDSKGRSRIAVHHNLMKPAYLKENIELVSKMISRLQENRVKVVLITLPVNQTYAGYCQADRYSRMQRELTELTVKYHIEYYNYFSDSRFVNDDFFDNDHLNQQGAEKMMEIMKGDFINRDLSSVICSLVE